MQTSANPNPSTHTDTTETDTTEAEGFSSLDLYHPRLIVGLAIGLAVLGGAGMVAAVVLASVNGQILQQPAMRALFMVALFASAACCVGAALAWRILNTRFQEPLVRLSTSLKQLVNNNLREPVWGTDRPDALGELARTVATTRDYFAHLPDVTVRQGDQTQRINFGGMGREAFSALCDTLTQSMVRFQDQFEQQQRQQAAVVEQQMQLNSQLRETVQGLQTQTVAQKESGQMVLSQLSSGYAEWQKKQQQQDQQFVQIWQQLARALEQQFGDVKAQQQKLAALTAQMIHTPEQLKHATQQVGQLSERFSAGASQLQDQLSAATAVLRASAQLAAETHELSRTQLVDATHQVHVAEETIMQFLDTANEKLSLATELTQALANVCAEANDRLRGINAAHTSMVEGKDKLLTIVNETQAFRPELLARTVSAILSQLQQLGGQLQQLASDVKNIQQPGAQAASTRTQRTLERLTQLRDMLSADERADERKVGG